MYKLSVINNKFRLFGKKETTTSYETLDELLEAVDKVEKDKSFYITDENGKIIDINKIRIDKPKEEVYTKILEVEHNGIKFKVTLTENKFTHDIKSKLTVDNTEKLYMNCMTEHKLFGRLELYDYFKSHLKELRDIELAYMIMNLIFNQ